MEDNWETTEDNCKSIARPHLEDNRETNGRQLDDKCRTIARPRDNWKTIGRQMQDRIWETSGCWVEDKWKTIRRPHLPIVFQFVLDFVSQFSPTAVVSQFFSRCGLLIVFQIRCLFQIIVSQSSRFLTLGIRHLVN